MTFEIYKYNLYNPRQQAVRLLAYLEVGIIIITFLKQQQSAVLVILL